MTVSRTPLRPWSVYIVGLLDVDKSSANNSRKAFLSHIGVDSIFSRHIYVSMSRLVGLDDIVGSWNSHLSVAKSLFLHNVFIRCVKRMFFGLTPKKWQQFLVCVSLISESEYCLFFKWFWSFVKSFEKFWK